MGWEERRRGRKRLNAEQLGSKVTCLYWLILLNTIPGLEVRGEGQQCGLRSSAAEVCHERRRLSLCYLYTVLLNDIHNANIIMYFQGKTIILSVDSKHYLLQLQLKTDG